MQAILDLAGEQYALFTAAQWKQAGFSVRALRRKEANGAVQEVHPGVFAVAGSFASFEQQVLAACLSVNGVASHRCAASNASKANQLLEWWILHFVWDDVHRWPEDTAEFLDRTIARRRRAA